jgi:hypothetical protein
MQLRILLLLLATALCLPACKKGSDFGLADLVLELRNDGAIVLGGGTATASYFSGEGALLEVDGRDVQAFEYLTAAAAVADASTISSDGLTIGATSVSWGGSPHFYRRDRMIVLYVGNDLTTTNRLARVMGAQIAGH